MTGLRMSAMNVGPLSPDANLLVPFAPSHLEVPTTAAVMVRPSHGVVLWDTGINDVVADPNRRDAYWGANVVAAFAPQAFTREHGEKRYG
jgi:N-acyl homoserine lactone hydrolase